MNKVHLRICSSSKNISNFDDVLSSATFEYFGKRVPDWTEMQKIWSICFDEMHIETVADIDRRLDCVVGPASEANLIFLVISIIIICHWV